MVFNQSQEQLAENQADLVRARTEDVPETYEEVVDGRTFLPALRRLHTLSQNDLEGFFVTALKSRSFISGLRLTLGENYEQTRRASNISGSKELASKDPGFVAKVLAMALMSDTNVIGFEVKVEGTPDNEKSSLELIVATETITPPTQWDETTGEALDGDEKFDPKLTLVYSPTVQI